MAQSSDTSAPSPWWVEWSVGMLFLGIGFTCLVFKTFPNHKTRWRLGGLVVPYLTIYVPLFINTGYGQFCFGQLCGMALVISALYALASVKCPNHGAYNGYPTSVYFLIGGSCRLFDYCSLASAQFRYGMYFGYGTAAGLLAVYFLVRQYTRQQSFRLWILVQTTLAAILIGMVGHLTFPLDILLVPELMCFICYRSLETMHGLIRDWIQPNLRPLHQIAIIPNMPIIGRVHRTAWWPTLEPKFFGCSIRDLNPTRDPLYPHHSLIHVIEERVYDDDTFLLTIWEWSKLLNQQRMVHQIYLPRIYRFNFPRRSRMARLMAAFESEAMISIFHYLNSLIKSVVHFYDERFKIAATFRLNGLRRAILYEGHRMTAFRICAAICKCRLVSGKGKKKVLRGWRFQLIVGYKEATTILGTNIRQHAPVLSELMVDFEIGGMVKVKVKQEISLPPRAPFGRCIKTVSTTSGCGMAFGAGPHQPFQQHQWLICFVFDFVQNRFLAFQNLDQVIQSDGALSAYTQISNTQRIENNILTNREAFLVTSNGTIQYAKIPIMPATLKLMCVEALIKASGGRMTREELLKKTRIETTFL